MLSKNKQENLIFNNDEILNSPLFIETPDLLAKFSYIKNTSILLQQNQLNFPLPIEVQRNFWIFWKTILFYMALNDTKDGILMRLKHHSVMNFQHSWKWNLIFS